MGNSQKESKFISLVVYLHNVENCIVHFLKTVIPVCENNFLNYEIICVNDGCTDSTVQKLKEYLEENRVGGMVNLIHMSFFQGMENAMNAGRDIAIGDFVYEFDDIYVDYEPEMLLKVYEKMIDGYDIVSASCKEKIRMSSTLFYTLYNKTSRMRNNIGPETFRLISRRAINRVKSIGQYIPYRKAVYSNCGLNMYTLYYESQSTKVRVKNKTVTAERTTLAIDSFIYFTNALERVSIIISATFLLITIGVGIYIITDLFNAQKPVEGWLSTMGFLALGFFGVFALLTIILKYLSLILNLIFKRQRYLIADIEKVVKNDK